MTTPNNTVAGLAEKWRADAARYADDNEAAAVESCAKDLEAALAPPAPSAGVVEAFDAAVAAAPAAPGAVDEAMVRKVAVAINAAWIGEGNPQLAWKRLGSNERKHKDAVALAALAAALAGKDGA